MSNCHDITFYSSNSYIISLDEGQVYDKNIKKAT